MARVLLALPLILLPCLVLGAEGTIRVAEDDCARLVEHRPADEVEYRSGVDVHGRPVVPADLDASELPIPDVIEIDITIDIQERFGIPADSTLFIPEAFIGVAVFRFADGRVTFNGVEVGDAEQRALAAVCAGAMR